MSKDYTYSYEWDSKYCYPNSFVLNNKFNITNDKELSLAEREYIMLSIAEIRTVNISKGNAFYNHMYIIDGAEFKCN